MAGGFRIVSVGVNRGSILRQTTGKVSQAFTTGAACEIAGNIISPTNSQTDKVDGIYSAMITPANVLRPATADTTSATGGEKIQYVPCRGNGLVFRTNLTGDDACPLAAKACNSNTSKTVVKATNSGSAGDFDAGTIYANGEQRNITTQTASGGVLTFNVDIPFTRAITTGDTCYAVPFARNTKGIKLSASSSASYIGISPAVADKSGGYCDIEDVDLANLTVDVTFQY